MSAGWRRWRVSSEPAHGPGSGQVPVSFSWALVRQRQMRSTQTKLGLQQRPVLLSVLVQRIRAVDMMQSSLHCGWLRVIWLLEVVYLQLL